VVILASDRVAELVQPVHRDEQLARRAEAAAEELASPDPDETVVVAALPAAVPA
jgi:hypothetical protein